MSKISIVDLEVFYCVGTTEEERAKPQRLLLTLDMVHDYSAAAVSDRLEKTINYFEVAKDMLQFGEGRSWKLIEKLSANIADAIIAKYKPESVTVQVKKFPIPQARWVSVSLTRTRSQR